MQFCTQTTLTHYKKQILRNDLANMSVPQRCLSLQGLRAKPRRVGAGLDCEIKIATDSKIV